MVNYDPGTIGNTTHYCNKIYKMEDAARLFSSTFVSRVPAIEKRFAKNCIGNFPLFPFVLNLA